MVERRAVEDGSMLAEGLSSGLAPESFGTGRVCIEPTCEVVLSRYNSTDWCALHESPAATGTSVHFVADAAPDGPGRDQDGDPP